MAYDPYALAGLAPQSAGALLGPHDGYTVLSATQTQMTDVAGNLIDALDIAFAVGAHPGVFTYSAPQSLYSWASPLAAVAELAQTIEDIYAIGSGAPPSPPAASSPTPSPFPGAPPVDMPSPTPSAPPPPRWFTAV